MAKTAAQKAEEKAAKLRAAEAEDTVDEAGEEVAEDEAEEEAEEAPAPKAKSKYKRATQAKIVALREAGETVADDESEEVINTMFEALTHEQAQDEATEAEEVPGVPNKMPVRTEMLRVGGKDVNFPIHFVAAVKGGMALYNERGQRISGVAAAGSPEATYLNRASARNNALRRANRVPEEFAAGQ